MTQHKSLTLAEIVECLADQHDEVDAKLLHIFLYTYRSFCEPCGIITLINKRLIYLDNEDFGVGNNATSYKGFVKAIIILFNSWLTFPFAHDFHELPDFISFNYLLKHIREWPVTISFIKSSTEFKESFQRLEVMLGDVLVKFNSIESNDKQDYRELPVDCHFRDSFAFNNPLKEEDLNKNFFDFSPETIAVSLSYIDQKVLQKLRLPELVKHAQRLPAPSVTDIINNYNILHNVVKIIVKQPILAKRRFDQYQYSGRNSPDSIDINFTKESRVVFSNLGLKNDQRYQVIERWILVSQILHQLRNFSSLVAILTALNSLELKNCMHILKIKKSPKLRNLYQSLLKVIEPYINQNKEELINSDTTSANSSVFGLKFFAKQKSKLKNIRYHSCEIPYLGIYLRNMTYINEGFSDYVNTTSKIYNGSDDRIINIDKCRRQFDVMAQVRLIISSLNFNDIKEDENFSNWYFYLQLEVKKAKRYTSDASLSSPTLSMESLKSLTSMDSSNSTDHSTASIFKSNFQSYMHLSHECLQTTHTRRRLQTSPAKIFEPVLSRNRSVGANLCVQSNDSKVATVKLRVSKVNSDKMNVAYQSSYFPDTKPMKPIRKHETISTGAARLRQRQLLTNLVRSSSSVDKNEERLSINLEVIHYKKIQIYEKDRTTDFIQRVLNKFGKPYLLPEDFDIVQIVENGKEIVITCKANLFYALAEKSEYLIEVRPREVTQ